MSINSNASFERWKTLVSAPTRYLAVAVERVLLPVAEGQGFQRVDYFLGDKATPLAPSEIVVERVVEDYIDYVDLTFAKYGMPRFQVGCARRARVEPHEFLRAANLVSRSGQYFHFWGKPWWMPLQLWPLAQADREVSKVASRLQQLITFLDTGVVGPNVRPSPFVNLRAKT